MPIVTISPEFEVVIPREIRHSLGLMPVQQMLSLQHPSRIELVRLPHVRELRGSLSGIDTTIAADEDRV